MDIVCLGPMTRKGSEPSFAPCHGNDVVKQAEQKNAGNRPEPATPYLGSVPDFILGDRSKLWAHSSSPSDRLGLTHSLRVAVHQAVIMQRTREVVIPDLILAQIIWGGSRKPVNWRNYLSWRCGRKSLEQDGKRGCPPTCPLHGNRRKHQHYRFCIKEGFLGFLELCLTESEVDGSEVLDFRRDAKVLDEGRQRALQEYREVGAFAPIYLPLELFGASQRAGLSLQERETLRGLIREITRMKKRRTTNRQDCAAPVQGGVVPAAIGSGQVTCPFLKPEVAYVGFNGNGRRRGMGYRLVGARCFGWVARTIAAIDVDRDELWASVRPFLKTLKKLEGPFALVVAGLHPVTGQWYSLNDLLRLSQSRHGKTVLDACHVRIYAPEDYLERWRCEFARRMGFSVIPGGTDAVSPADEDASPAASPSRLAQYLDRVGMTAKGLARELGVSDALVSYRLTGTRPWTAAFRKRVEEWLNRRTSELVVLTNSL